jgi:hypothetical protein
VLLRVLKPGGTIGVTTPGLKADPYEARVPANVQSLFGYEVGAWHTPEWWRRHWELGGRLEDIEAAWLPDERENWILWVRAVREVKGTDEDPVLENASGGRRADRVRVGDRAQAITYRYGLRAAPRICDVALRRSQPHTADQ